MSDMRELAAKVLDKARARGLRIATAESCTGGLVAAALTSVAGSSDVFERGFVTYSNAAKAEMLSVDAALLARYGAVSSEVARAMAEGAIQNSKAQLAVAVTGIAGPGGGTAEKPVGLVHFAAAFSLPAVRADAHGLAAIGREAHFGDLGRNEVRSRSVATALQLLLEAADLV